MPVNEIFYSSFNIFHVFWHFLINETLLIYFSGMMIESMAGKSAALHGIYHDATPFTFSEDQSATEYFGNLLSAG